jgi:hypothetical protein
LGDSDTTALTSYATYQTLLFLTGRVNFDAIAAMKDNLMSQSLSVRLGEQRIISCASVIHESLNLVALPGHQTVNLQSKEQGKQKGLIVETNSALNSHLQYR